MKNTELISFGTDSELAQSAAVAWLEEVAAANRSNSPYCVALSGGRITLKLFAAVIEAAKTRGTSFAGVEFFWVDERCVPPDDPESNFAAANKFFFQPLGIETAKIHRILGEESPEFAVQEAEAEVCRIAPLNADGQPVLDLIFLGMGEDGHVASLFPSEPPAVMSNRAVYRAVTAVKPPPRRITLSYGTIAAAKQVWVLASGPGKEAALRESLRPDGQTPLIRVLRSRQNTKILTDVRLG